MADDSPRAIPAQPDERIDLSARALQFHREHDVCDMIGLNLTHPRIVIENVDLGRRDETTCRGDFPKFKAWGLGLVMCKGGPVYYDDNYRVLWLSQIKQPGGRERDAMFLSLAIKNPTQLLLAVLDRFLSAVEANADQVTLVRGRGDIDAAREQGKVALLMGCNRSDWFADSPGVLHMLARLGLRTITIAQSGRELGYDAYDEIRSGGRMTALGARMITEMNRAGILIDISHLNDHCALDVIETSEQPVVASHSTPRAIGGALRDIPDSVMVALARKGGLLGIIPPISRPPGPLPSEAGPLVSVPRREIEATLRLIHTAVDVMGIEHVGIGTHFNSACLPWVTEALLGDGFSSEDAAAIIGGNYLRVLRQVLPA
ncbi:MAG: dipeptidase [Chloroflexi bacterium]|nr:dipeptidase [Chloroflexota bacterium]MCL5274650.1 dipeptidase [Chloroflexota bacterium]